MLNLHAVFWQPYIVYFLGFSYLFKAHFIRLRAGWAKILLRLFLLGDTEQLHKINIVSQVSEF